MILSIRLGSISNVPQEHCDTSILIGPKLNGGFFSPLNQTGPTVSGPGLLLPRVQLGPAYGRFIRNWPFTIVLLNDGFVPTSVVPKCVLGKLYKRRLSGSPAGTSSGCY